MDEEVKLPDEPKDLFDRRSVRWTLFIVIPAVVFILVCAGIRVSQYGINHTILVFGQKELVARWPAAIRITLMADGGGFFLPDGMTGHLVRGATKDLLFEGVASDSGYALARNFRVPDISPGKAQLELDIRFDDKRRIVRADVEIVSEPPEHDVAIPKDAKDSPGPNDASKGDNRILLSTEDRGAPTGLASVLFMRSQGPSGKPVSEELEMELLAEASEKDEKKKFRTDRLGLFALSVKPLELTYPVKLYGVRPTKDTTQADGGPLEAQEAVLFPKVVYAGLTAQLHNPVVWVDSPLRVTARQISSSGPVYADIFHEGRWVQAISGWFGGGKADLEIRPSMTGLGRLQITTSAIAPGKTVAVRHFYVLKQNETYEDGLRAVLKKLESSAMDSEWAKACADIPLERGSGFDRRLAAAYALSRMYAGHQVIPKLVSSRREDDAELNEFKAGFQKMVMLAIVLLGIGVTSLIAMMAVQSQRRHQRITMMILEEGALEGESDLEWRTDMGERASKRRVLFQGVILILIIMGAFASIALLINTLRWYHL